VTKSTGKNKREHKEGVRYEDKGGETDVEVLNIYHVLVCSSMDWIKVLVGTTPMPL
jgi:hypothetical protein